MPLSSNITYKQIINTIVPGSQPQIDSNTVNTNDNITELAINDRLHVSGNNYSNNSPEGVLILYQLPW